MADVQQPEEHAPAPPAEEPVIAGSEGGDEHEHENEHGHENENEEEVRYV